ERVDGEAAGQALTVEGGDRHHAGGEPAEHRAERAGVDRAARGWAGPAQQGGEPPFLGKKLSGLRHGRLLVHTKRLLGKARPPVPPRQEAAGSLVSVGTETKGGRRGRAETADVRRGRTEIAGVRRDWPCGGEERRHPRTVLKS